MTGTDVWMDIGISVTATAPSCNTASIKLYGWPGDDDTQRALIKTFSSAATITNYSLTHSAGMISQSVPLGEMWTFELVVDNGYYSVSTQARVNVSTAPLHIAGSGYGVGIGCYSDGEQSAPKLQVAWPMYYQQCGYLELGANENVPAGGYLDKVITFQQAFADVPVVIVGFTSDSVAGAFGKRCCAVLHDSSLTASGFKVRIFNGDTSNRQPSIAWIAVGRGD